MNILSYRGPGSAGGVSGTISGIMRNCAQSYDHWWHLYGTGIATRVSTTDNIAYVCNLQPGIVAGHYRYCNEFLWPILHDMPELAVLRAEDRTAYQQFNLAFTHHAVQANTVHTRPRFFIQDYQLALAPALISRKRKARINVFWHIPWPKNVDEAHVADLIEIAQSLLSANKIGFHTSEYADNFLRFAAKYLPEHPNTKIIVHPLGLDYDYWSAQDDPDESKELLFVKSLPKKFVLSVDRADYTKGIIQRIKAIEHFFADYPEMRNEISFVQICQRSRAGLPAFDQYWQECQQAANIVNMKFARDSWQPLVWVQEALSSDALAYLYKRAEVMLVNPLRDGLNLTAKEFAACSKRGVLLLSPQAGVWHEFKNSAVSLDPACPQSMASQIFASLAISEEERCLKIAQMKLRLKQNPLSDWWEKFDGRSQTLLPLPGGSPFKQPLLQDRPKILSQ
ncbi:MAG: trehalose-6-phosphate synthase [Candidatus Obscuribacterales bacterium]|nr:trehalose-6-phosphate synthase [Candidatus Obscuribacterales bacterium]